MKRHLLAVLKTVCWLTIAGSVLAGAWFGWAMHEIFAERDRPGFYLFCGNTVSDPLGIMLSYASPLSLLAAATLGVLWRQGKAGGGSVAAAVLLTLPGTLLLIAFGKWFFRNNLPGHRLSDIVWWMQWPGEWFGA